MHSSNMSDSKNKTKTTTTALPLQVPSQFPSNGVKSSATTTVGDTKINSYTKSHTNTNTNNNSNNIHNRKNTTSGCSINSSNNYNDNAMKVDEEFVDDEILNDILIIAKAYREAHEMDTLDTMNVQRSRKIDTAQKLYFYVIEAKWFRRAWAILNGSIPDTNNDIKFQSDWREVIVQQISNSDLLLPIEALQQQYADVNTDDIDNDDESMHDANDPLRYKQSLELQQTHSSPLETIKKPKLKALQSSSNTAITMLQHHLPARQQQQQEQLQDHHHHTTQTRNTSLIRNNVSIENDYFLVGSYVWLLLKQKFGYDYEIKFSCTFVPGKHPTDPPSLAVKVMQQLLVLDEGSNNNNNNNNESSNNNYKDHILIKVPDTGRFPYETVLGKISNEPTTITSTDTSSNIFAGSSSLQKMSMSSKPSPVIKTSQINRSVVETTLKPKGNLVPVVSTSTTTGGNNVSDDEEIDDTEASSVHVIYEPLDDHNNDSSEASNENDAMLDNDIPIGQQPIILLPPSEPIETRTSVNITNRVVEHLDDDYEYEDDDDEGEIDDKGSEDIASGGAAMSTTTAGTLTVPRRRMYGSGLGNLGNTCFMNSTLQCIAHTEPLQRYFLSGDYEGDLNRDNPLGTGGELAIQFAKLLKEMYIVEPPRSLLNNNTRNTRYMSAYNAPTNDFATTTNVVYPRNFKTILGKHAEQFMGYDQHDSQELATYLLDALHEDTNRVTIKPYVQKPEQGENESDKVAARKAWELHLTREDSRVLENFMGLIKSRVECNTAGCGRVSTTFDPVMYLSVPIPGSSERILQVTYVPLEPSERPKILSISIAKSANLNELLKKVQTHVAEQFPTLSKSALDDLCATDIWQKEVNIWFSYKHAIEEIREQDVTFVYELRSEKEIRKLHDEKQNSKEAVPETALRLGVHESNVVRRYQLDPFIEETLNKSDDWVANALNYVHNPLNFCNTFDRRKGSTDERVGIYRRLVTLIDLCHKDAEEAAAAIGNKRSREDTEQKKKRSASTVTLNDDPVPAIEERCSLQRFFTNVRSRLDLAKLECIAEIMRNEILDMERGNKSVYTNGIIIEICMRKVGCREIFVAPFLLRIPGDMTVFELRKEIAKRLARSIRPNSGVRRESVLSSTGQSTSELVNIVGPSPLSPSNDSDAFGPQELLVLRQTPLSYELRSANHHVKHYLKAEQLGSLLLDQSDSDRPVSTLASPSDKEEKIVVSEYVSNHDRIYINWPLELLERSFDAKEFENVDDQFDSAGRIQSTKNKPKSVLDCIDKFCQKEQLEETEQWYCNKCKKHVRAWKQFHLYRSPPHLIVHLKRFHFSPTTHRRNKITALIDFPLKGLDLSEHFIHWSDDNNDKPIYDCYAVTNHFGGLGGGHYTAYALNPDDTWCLYDDSRITTSVNPKDVVSSAAYVLYYRRRDVPVTEEFELNLQTGATIQFANGPTLIQNDRESKINSSPSSRSSSIVGSNVAVIDDGGMASDECDSTAAVKENRNKSNSINDDDFISAQDVDDDDDGLLSDAQGFDPGLLSEVERFVVEYDPDEGNDNDIDNNIDDDADDDDEGTSDRSFLPHTGKTMPSNSNNSSSHRFDRDKDRDASSYQLPRQ